MKSQGTDRGAYISEMAWELAKMARADGNDVLCYLLEVAAVEAEASGKSHDEKSRPASKRQDEVQRL